MNNVHKKSNNNRIKLIFLCIFLSISIALSAFYYVKEKFLHKFNDYDKQISSLQSEVDYLKEIYNQSLNYYEYDLKYNENSYNYLAIGNSLTLISTWGRGICSTKPDNDYFHLVCKYLEKKSQNVVAYPNNFAYWERSDNRNDLLNALDIYLNEDLDLVTIQLGENCSDLTTYESDLEYLCKYIQSKCHNATIVIVGDFWSTERNDYRLQVANSLNLPFADLSEIINDASYQSSTGTLCYLQDGSTIEVSENAHTHPNDKGMEYIASKIIEQLQ